MKRRRRFRSRIQWIDILVYEIIHLRNLCLGSHRRHGELIVAKVKFVIDGDSILLDTNEEIRLADFDAPEIHEPHGRRAKSALWRIAHGRQVVCTCCEGARGRCRSYGRIVATCRLNGIPLGQLMRARGIPEGGRGHRARGRTAPSRPREEPLPLARPPR